jgi:hypothetical protein
MHELARALDHDFAKLPNEARTPDLASQKTTN